MSALATLKMAIFVALQSFTNLEDIMSLTGQWEMTELDMQKRLFDISL